MIRIILLSLLLSMVCLCGCQSGQKDAQEQEFMTQAQIQEARLLEQIERKYESPEAHYELGRLYQGQGRWKKAAFHYNVTRGYDPVHYKAAAGQVKVLMMDGQTVKAKKLAEIFVEQVNYQAPASMMQGRAFQMQMLDDYTLKCYQQAMQLSPENPIIAKRIAYFHLHRKELKLAEQYFKRSFTFDPYQPDVARELGKLGIIVELSAPEEEIAEEQ